MKLLSNLFAAVAAIFGFRRDAANRSNTPEMRANVEAARDAEIKADAAEALKRRDIDEIRRRLSCIVVTLCLLLCMAGSGCATTVVPERVEAPTAATYDATDTTTPTSGILSIDDEGATITAEARDRYNALVRAYRDRWQPAMGHDYGVAPLDTSPPTYRLSNAALQRWLVMAEWRRMGER